MDHKYIDFGSRYLVENYDRPESERSILAKYYYAYEDVPIIELDQMDAVINPPFISEEFRMFSLRVKQPPQSYISEEIRMFSFREKQLLQSYISEEFRMFSFRVKQPPQSYSELGRLSDRKVHERYDHELRCLFNMFHYNQIGAKKLDAALKSLKEKYWDWSTDRCRIICRGDVAGTSLSRPSSLEGAGNPSTSGYPPGTHACGGGVPVGIGLVNKNGDPSSSVKHSPLGKEKAPHEEGAGNPSTSRYPLGTHACGGGVRVGIGLVNNNGDSISRVKHSPPGKGKVRAGGFANVSGDATGSMNAPCEGDLEMGRVNNNNGDPLAPGDVPSSVVPHVGHTADRSGEYGVNVARTVFRVSAAAASRSTTSNFAKASYAISLADSGAAILLADTHWKAATPILAKAGIVACGVGVLADMGKDLPLPLFTGAIIAAIFIIIAAMVFAKRLA